MGKMKLDEVKRDAIFRGNLLEVSSLLTKLQSHLVPEGLSRIVPSTDTMENNHEDDSSGGRDNDEQDDRDFLVVTTQDLTNVLQFRDLLAKEEDLLNSMAAAQETARSNRFLKKLCRLITDNLRTDLENNQTTLKERTTTRTKRIHFLWTRMEVWWTKIAAQQFLVVPVKEFSDDPSKVPACCFSPLLNLPGSQHFRNILPEPVDDLLEGHSRNAQASAFYQNTLSCCSLPLPPNKHTWKEFARISRMVSLLEHWPEDGRRTRNRSPLEQAWRSPCCVHDALINRTKHVQAAQGQNFDFAPPHLIALWVRAQRNTQAMRHLWMIFEVFAKVDKPSSLPPSQAVLKVRGGGTRGTGKELVVEGGDEAIESASSKESEGNCAPVKSRSFVPILRGNPNHIRIRTVDLSKRADQLVEWAVTNQVLFTHRHIQKYLMMAPSFQKENGIASIIEMEQRQRKRIRRDISQGSDLAELKAACLAYVFRWFSRRNRPLTSYLFDRSINNYHLDLGWYRSDEKIMKDFFQQVEAKVKALLVENEASANSKVHAQDRTFARVDRRLGINYDGSGRITLLDQVTAMLNALLKSRAWNAGQYAEIQRARKDMEELYRYFLGDSRDVYDMASDLIVDKEIDSAGEIADLLNSAPQPWPNCCSACSVKEGPLVSCTNCEKVYHSETCSAGHVKLDVGKVLASRTELRRLCKLERPSGTRQIIPDYTNPDSFNHEVIVIDIKRDQREDGSVTPLGLTLRTVEDSEAIFDRLSSNSATVMDLVDILNTTNRRPVYPMKGIHGAYVVVETKENGCAKPAGIKISDVLLSVEHLQIADPEQAAKYESMGVVNMVGLPNKEKLEHLKVASTRLRLTIFRPDRNIVKESRDWFESVKRLNKIRSTLNCWYCKDCLVTDALSDRPEPMESRVVDEALRCRAVIRRIGLENYALAFVDEDIFSIRAARENGNESDGMFFSLRRLDAMMTFIIDVHSNNGDKKSLSTAFDVPPWATPEDTTRGLEWAPEGLKDKPLNLLISALLAWQEVLELNETRKMSRDKTMRHFLLLLISWCVLPSARTGSLERTKGPPELFLCIREPWLCRTCLFCCSQPRDGGSVACQDAACSKMTRNDLVNMNGVKHEDAKNSLREVVEYNECSSLVGMTFLVVPDDPLVHALKPLVGGIDHCGRPVEFIVASYIPAAFVPETISKKSKDVFFDKFSDGEGIFHLLPVVTTVQLAYLLERCKTRKKITDKYVCRDLSWVSLDVFNEAGVARYSLPELKKKLDESDSIRRSIDEFVATENGVDESETKILFSGSQWSMESEWGFSHPSSEINANILGAQKHLVDRLLQKGFLPESIRRAFNPERIAGDLDVDIWESEFGDSHVQKGLQITNSTPILLDVVKPVGTGCILLYSDLHFSLPTEMPSLIDRLEPNSLCRPGIFSESHVITILLERSDSRQSSEEYKGVGFGFEIVRWARDRSPRIGRVHRHSPAFVAGLQSGDILLSAGGKDIAELGSISSLATAILGATMHIRLAPNVDEPLRSVLSAVKESKRTLDSVVLVIERPKQEGRAQQNLQSTRQENQQEIASEAEPDNCDPFSIWQRTMDANTGHQVASERLTAVRNEGNPQIEINHCGPPHVQQPPVTPAPRLQGDPASARQQSNTYAASTDRIEPRNPLFAAPEDAAGPGTQIVPHDLPQNSQTRPWVNELSHQQPQPQQPSSRRPRLENLLMLLMRIAASSEPRDTATFVHLYRPAGGGTILTVMESSLFLECLQNQKPKLGVRLLCPRYEMNVVASQAMIMADWSEQQIRGIPRISRGVFKEMRTLDDRRSMSRTKPELGPVVFREGFKEYKAPVDILPVDRAIERSLQREREKLEAQRYAFEAHYQSTTHLGYPATTQSPSHEDFPFDFSLPPPSYGHAPYHGSYGQQDHGPGYNPISNQANAFGQLPRMNYPPRSGHEAHPLQTPQPVPESTDGTNEVYWFGPPANDHGFGNRQGSYSFGASADQAIALDDDNENDRGIAERIRGGGPLEGINATCIDAIAPELEQQQDCLMPSSAGLQDAKCITHVALEEWTGQAVYTFVDTDEANSEAMIVGWVKNAAPLEEGLPETVDVEAHYLANVGYFARPKIFEVYPEEVFLVDEDSQTEEATVIKKLHADGSAPAIVRPTTRNTAPLCHELALAYAKTLTEGLKFMGSLPDGREVVWLANDPSALYLAKTQVEESIRAISRDYGDLIGEQVETTPLSCPRLVARAGALYCPWGCSIQTSESNEVRDALVLDSVDDFRKHCADCHGYGSLADTMVTIGDKPFTRVSQGSEMLELSSGISSAIVAHRPSAWSHAVKTSLTGTPGAQFTQSPTGEKLLLPWADTSLRARLSEEARQSKKQNFLSFVNLWSAIGHLFEIDGSGLFILSQSEFEASTSDHYISIANEKHCHIGNCCQLIPPSTNADSRFLDCALCSLPWERCIGKPALSSQLDDATPELGTSNDSRGLGCVLRSDASFQRSNDTSKETSFVGATGEAKALLIEVAELIPPGLKLSTPIDERDPLEGFRLWEEAHLDVWKRFVRNCSTPSMFSQALVVLLGSIDRAKMPRWWKQDGGGWSTSQMIMAHTSMETFFLHLYVLDAALSEVIGRTFLPRAPKKASSTRHEDRSSLIQSLERRMKVFMSFADELEGHPRYNGAHEEDCMFCDEGGELLCCELCSNVVHAKCLDPPLEDEEAKNNLDQWVCDSCVNDLCAKKGVDREDIERQYPILLSETPDSA